MAESIADKLKKAWKHITTDSNELAKELRRLDSGYIYQSGSKKTALVKRAKDNIKKRNKGIRASKELKDIPPGKKPGMVIGKPKTKYTPKRKVKGRGVDEASRGPKPPEPKPVSKVVSPIKPVVKKVVKSTTKIQSKPQTKIKPVVKKKTDMTTAERNQFKQASTKARSIKEAKEMGVPHFYNKAGKKLAAVTKEELAASGAKDLTAYLNKQKRDKAASKVKSKSKGVSLYPRPTSTADAKQKATSAKMTATIPAKTPPKGLLPPSVREKSKPPQGLRPPSVREKSRAKTPKKSGKGTLGFKQISGKKDWSGGIREYETPFGNITLDSSQENLTDEQKERKKIGLSYKKGGQIKVPKKKKIGKKKQGYKARKDESIAMRVKKKRTKKQLKASRSDSYGKFGKGKGKGKINRSGAALVAASYD